MKFKGNIIVGDTTKTENGTRIIKMNHISRQILNEALEHKISNPNHFLFCKPDGTLRDF